LIPEEIDNAVKEEILTEPEERAVDQRENPPVSSGLAINGPGFSSLSAGGTAAGGVLPGGETPVQEGQPGGPDTADPGNSRNLSSCIMPPGNGIGYRRKGVSRIRPRCGDIQRV
jgi:hypothetical protein